MLRARLGILGMAVVALLAFPREGSAYIFDFIWQMSGAQMYGPVLLHCRIDIAGGPAECRTLDRRLTGNLGGLAARRAWVSFEGTFYTSTGKNAEGDDYRAWRTQMVAFEPILEVRSATTGGGATIYHGLVGLSYDVLFGSDFDTFDKVGIKFRPIGVAYKKIDFGINVRVYPNGFGRDEFGFAPRLGDVDRPVEAIYGASFGLKW